MLPNPQDLRIWSHLLKKSLMENFIFLCSEISSWFYVSLLLSSAARILYSVSVNLCWAIGQLYLVRLFYVFIFLCLTVCLITRKPKHEVAKPFTSLLRLGFLLRHCFVKYVKHMFLQIF